MTDSSDSKLVELQKEVEHLRMHISNLDEAMYHDRQRAIDTSKTVNGLVVRMDALTDRVDDLFENISNQVPAPSTYRIGEPFRIMHCPTCTCTYT